MEKQTEMVSAPKKTEMVDAHKGNKPKMFKVKALREFNIEEGGQPRLVKANEIVEVSKEQARDLCKPIHGTYAFTGERHLADKDCPRHQLGRARLATEQDLFEAKPLTPLTDEFED